MKPIMKAFLLAQKCSGLDVLQNAIADCLVATGTIFCLIQKHDGAILIIAGQLDPVAKISVVHIAVGQLQLTAVFDIHPTRIG